MTNAFALFRCGQVAPAAGARPGMSVMHATRGFAHLVWAFLIAYPVGLTGAAATHAIRPRDDFF
jgi:hypothetical protein